MVDEVSQGSSASPPTTGRRIVSVVIGAIVMLIGLHRVYQDYAFHGQPNWVGVVEGLGLAFLGLGGILLGAQRRGLFYGFLVAFLACVAVSVLLRSLG